MTGPRGSAEQLPSPDRIANLQYHMMLEFTDRVGRLHRQGPQSPLKLRVASYVQKHLSEPVSIEKLAGELFLSRLYLSRRFREETGMTLTDFILGEKTEEAKRLLLLRALFAGI